MALYEVRRTGRPLKDEFVEGLVIAYSRKSAREAVAHLPGVTGENVEAFAVSTVAPVQVVSVYYAEA